MAVNKSLLLLLLGVTFVTAQHIDFYRKDYTYFKEFDAFYKVHWDINGVSHSTAFLSCNDEGAQLFYPEHNDEWRIVKNLTDTLPEYPNVTSIFVGIHDEMGLGEFITVDGHPTPFPLLIEDSPNETDKNCVLMDIETGAYAADDCNVNSVESVRPYVCKRKRDATCPTIDKDYKHSKELNRCYKVNDRIKTWNEAMRTCFMEGGILAVIENKAQSEIIRDMIPREVDYFVGFKKSYDDELYTVKGKKLQNSGYERWSDPNNDQNHNCGVVYKHYEQDVLYTLTVDCDVRRRFICEMEMRS